MSGPFYEMEHPADASWVRYECMPPCRQRRAGNAARCRCLRQEQRDKLYAEIGALPEPDRSWLLSNLDLAQQETA